MTCSTTAMGRRAFTEGAALQQRTFMKAEFGRGEKGASHLAPEHTVRYLFGRPEKERRA